MSEQTYKIVAFDGPPRDWEYQGNKFRSYYAKFEGDDRRIEIAQKPETPAPNIGDELTGAITEKNGYFKFKKAHRAGFNGGGPRPEDPKRAARILRQHSQDMSIETLKLAQTCGIAPAFESVSDLVKAVKALADVYDKDAEGAAS